jgi:hypothetical protein
MANPVYFDQIRIRLLTKFISSQQDALAQGASGNAGQPQQVEEMDTDEYLNGVQQLFRQSKEAKQAEKTIAEKAKEYLEKKRRVDEANKQRLRNMIDCDWLLNDTISKSSSEDMAASMKANGMEAAPPVLGSFVDPN